MPDNPIFERLIDLGGGEAIPFIGYLSTKEDGRIRLYQTLSTDVFIELSRDDILYIKEPGEPEGETIVYLKRDANVRAVIDRTFNLREMRPAPVRPASSPPDQPAGGGLSADSPASLTHCALGLEITVCVRVIDRGSGTDVYTKSNGYSIHSAHLICGPSHVIEKPC